MSLNLSGQFLRMYPIKDLCWKDIQDSLSSLLYEESQASQNDILQQTILHPYAQKFPPTSSYKRIFLKTLISHIEQANIEVSERIYEEYMDLLNNSIERDNFCYRTYNMSDPDLPTVTIKESCNLISNGTTGMCTWEASHVLAKWCLNEKERLYKKNIIELGAGLGLTGLTVIQACHPNSYIFTDIHSSVLKTLAENLKINQNGSKIENDTNSDIQANSDINSTMAPEFNCDEEREFGINIGDTHVKVSRLDWSEGTFDLDVDVVLAADVVYDNEVTIYLVQLLKLITSKLPTVDIFVASTLRNPDTYAFFKYLLASENLNIKSEIEKQYQDFPSQPKHSIFIVHITSMDNV